MAKGQAERLFGLLEELMKEGGATWRDLGRIGVGIGPGNFTGTRISVASARGLALSLAIPAVGVSTFEALALGHPRPIVACVDGRAGRVYCQSFELNGTRAPVTAQIDAMPADLFGNGQSIVGDHIDVIEQQSGAVGCSPIFGMAVAIGKIAGDVGADLSVRPAPIYMRAPDAARARDTAPVILS